jgi:hypothetical protein
MKSRLKMVIYILIAGVLLGTSACGKQAQEVPQGVYDTAEKHVGRYLRDIESFSSRGVIEYVDSTMLERARLGTAIRVFHEVHLSQILTSNYEELHDEGVLVRYEVPILIDGVPWECLMIRPDLNHDGKWRCVGSREADETYLCYETIAVGDSTTSVEIDYFIFRDRGGPPIVHVALVKLNDTYYLAPLNNPAARALCGVECDFKTMQLIKYCDAVEYYRESSD